jgi:hypothetical protein
MRSFITLKEREHWEDLDFGGLVILKWLLEKYDGMVLTGLIWLRTLNTVLNLQVARSVGKFFERLLASQGHCFMQSVRQCSLMK